MANPQNPGMVSGPGRLSKRTDLPPKGQPIRKLPNAAYGAVGVTSCNGDIGIRTRGFGANTSYTIIVEVRKQNEYYQRGQFNDPAAFNYGPDYSLRP